LKIGEGSPNQAEAAVRELGDALGFTATRPDNDHDTGPDVLWLDEENRECIAFELKTDKLATSNYTKDDIGQGHNHLAWVNDKYKHIKCLGLLFVGSDLPVGAQASPSPDMSICETTNLVSLANGLVSCMKDIKAALPLQRSKMIFELCRDARWSNASLFQTLEHRSFAASDDLGVLE
jgi:hypothetical protein